MKRQKFFQCMIFLLLFVVAWASPGLAEDRTMPATDQIGTMLKNLPYIGAAEGSEITLTGLSIDITPISASISLTAGTILSIDISESFDVTVSGDYGISGTEILDASLYKLTWSTESDDLTGISLDINGKLTITENVSIGTYTIPVTVLAEYEDGTLSDDSTADIIITVAPASNDNNGGGNELTPSIDTNGKVTYNNPPSTQVGFNVLLTNLIQNGINLSNVKEIEIPNNVANLDGIEALTSLVKLDLKKASSLTIVKVTSNSSVTEIDLSDNNSITSVDLSGSNIESLDMTGSVVTKLSVANCTNLTTLKCEADPGAGTLEEINLAGCSNLTELSCGGNKLLWLNLSDCTKLTKLSYSGQSRSNLGKIFSARINFKNLLWNLLYGTNYDSSSNTLFDISNISGVQYTSDDVNYGNAQINSNGYANLPFTPVSIKYNYQTNYKKNAASYGSVAGADENDGNMDVALNSGEIYSSSRTNNKLDLANVGCHLGFSSWLIFAVFILMKRQGIFFSR